jgi:L-ascorbate metabolism protein UlaG (beta-lactamase superfamily)
MPTVQLVRHATLLVTLGETTFLVDPMLGEPGDIPPIPNTPNDRENPLVERPDVDLTHDAVVVTHRHRDHFDDAAREFLDREVPLFCHPEEADEFREEGFEDVRPLDIHHSFGDVILEPTPARHGHGELAEKMAPVLGVVFEGAESLYLAGDTVWYDAVAETIDAYDFDAVVVNAGGARFVEGEPITMDEDDVASVRAAVDDDVPVIADHMDAINHCLVTRADLRAAVDGVTIPEDGEIVEF